MAQRRIDVTGLTFYSWDRMVVHQEIQEKLRTIEFIPPGIDMLIVAPQRLLSDQPHSRLTKVEGMLMDKITGRDVLADETWDGDATNFKTFRYDIVAPDVLTLYGMARFIVYTAYRKLVPGGNISNW